MLIIKFFSSIIANGDVAGEKKDAELHVRPSGLEWVQINGATRSMLESSLPPGFDPHSLSSWLGAKRYLSGSFHWITVEEGEDPRLNKVWDESKHPRGGHPENRGEFSENPNAAQEPEQRSEEDIIRDGKVVRQRKLGQRAEDDLPESGVNTVFKAYIDGNGAVALKPDFSQDERESANEVMAYRISKAMGFDIVPETVFRDFDDINDNEPSYFAMKCSAQRWIEGSMSGAEAYDSKENVIDPEKFSDGMSKILVLDALIANIDRHDGNYVIEKSTGNIFAIDNGSSFHKNTTARYGIQNSSDNVEMLCYHMKMKSSVKANHIAAAKEAIDNGSIKKILYELMDPVDAKYHITRMADAVKIMERAWR